MGISASSCVFLLSDVTSSVSMTYKQMQSNQQALAWLWGGVG